MASGQIVLVCGYRRSGKDTFADLLTTGSSKYTWRIYRRHDVDRDFETSIDIERLSFAKYLKQLVANKLDISEQYVDVYKEWPLTFDQFINYKWYAGAPGNPTIRDVLIDMALKMRDKNPDCFVDYVLKTIDYDKQYVITDWRYKNELSRVLEECTKRGVTVTTVRVVRQAVPTPPPEVLSEHNLDDVATEFIVTSDVTEYDGYEFWQEQ
jgi:hypothetical protein